MFHFDIEEHKYPKIHFIGIGGVSMSGIAMLLLKHGYEITGSDREESQKTKNLEKQGARISFPQSASNVRDQDLFVYTDAILPDNDELVAAQATGKPCVTRGQFLGALMRNYKYSIAVSGSHGKSTTTSILAKILVNSPTDPTILLGGSLDEIDGNVRVGFDEYLVTEACEYKGNILYYYPQLSIILNIDADHLDYYRNLDHIIDTFIGYMKNMTPDSKVVINIDDKNNLKLLPHIPGRAITFGVDNPKAMYNATNLSFDAAGHPSFDIVLPNKETAHFKLKIIGRYNIYNATAAIVAAYETGISIEDIQLGVDNYTSLHRRMEIVGYRNGATVMTDYGHHPTEIKATLSALAEYKRQRLICVFQPHTYSRTKSLLDDFANSFYDADEVIVTEIYAAREKFDPTIKSEDLVEKLVTNGVNAKYIQTFEEAEEYLRKDAELDDLIITTGCGNPDVLARMLVK